MSTTIVDAGGDSAEVSVSFGQVDIKVNFTDPNVRLLVFDPEQAVELCAAILAAVTIAQRK